MRRFFSMRSLPGLTAPFAVVGAAAGWLAAGFVANPLVDVAYGGKQLPAALLGGATCALVGAALTPTRLRAVTFWAWLQLAPLVLLGGAVCGLIVGWITGVSSYGAVTGAVVGAVAGGAFLPVCGLVLAAARRALRARLGSVVAASDRRAVWQLVAASICVATLAALLDWPAALLDGGPTPYVALGIALVTAFVTVGLLLADVAARHLVAVESARATELGVAGDIDAAVPSMDLGLGDEVLAAVEGRSAYRSSSRADALVVGSPEAAGAALRRALLRGVACAGVGILVLGAHAWATAGGGRLAYAEARCERGSPRQCRNAAIELEVRDDPDMERVGALHGKACIAGETESCDRLRALWSIGRIHAPGQTVDLLSAVCEGDTSMGCKALFVARRVQAQARAAGADASPKPRKRTLLFR